MMNEKTKEESEDMINTEKMAFKILKDSCRDAETIQSLLIAISSASVRNGILTTDDVAEIHAFLISRKN